MPGSTSSDSQCTSNIRPNWKSSDADWCYVLPVVDKIEINNTTENVTLAKNGFVNLTFISKVDNDQEPMIAYKVDWGDGEITSVSGVEMRDRSNEENPHSLYHLYDYWDLKQKGKCESLNGGISTTGYCYIQPKVWVKDNWGWYSQGVTWNTAPDSGDVDKFNNNGNDSWIIVKEK